MRRDDVRRYCLDCSRDTGRLVERTSAVLSRRADASRKRSQAKAATKRRRKAAKERPKREARKALAKSFTRQARKEAAEKARVEALTELTAESNHALRTRGMHSARQTGENPYRANGISITMSATGHPFVPGWAYAIMTDDVFRDIPKMAGGLVTDLMTRERHAHTARLYGLRNGLLRWLASTPEIADAIDATVDVRGVASALPLAVQHYPFPIDPELKAELRKRLETEAS